MAVIKGYLQNGASKPITDSTIVLKAKKNTNSVLIKTEAFEVSQDGYYEMNVLPCTYDVVLLEEGFPPKQLGTIEVFANSTTGTLNDFLLLPKVGQTVTPEIIEQIVEERIKAQQAVVDSKGYAANAKNSENNAASTLANAVKKTGDNILGNVIFLGQNKWLVFKNGAYENQIRINGANQFCFTLYDSISNSIKDRIMYSPSTNNLDFQNLTSVTINGKQVLKRGDGGLVSSTGAQPENVDSFNMLSGIYGTTTDKFGDNPYKTLNRGSSLLHLPTHNASYKIQLLASAIGAESVDLWLRGSNYNGNTAWQKVITTANSTVDSNGFLKSASPILRLFANDDIEIAGGFTKAGCGLVNSEAKGVMAKRIGIGNYEIHGSLGFAKEGWYITLPEDANGNKKFFVEYSTDENNVITVKTYKKKWSAKLCEVVAGEPVDIKDGRWIDLRLEMPIVEVIEPVLPIPSLLNAVII